MIDDSLLIRGIYEAACDDKPWDELFAQFTRSFNAQSAQLFTPLAAPASTQHVSLRFQLPDDLIGANLTECHEVDLWYLAMVRRHGPLKTGFTYVTDGLVDDTVLQRSRFFADYLRPMELGHTVGAVISDGTDGDGLPLMGINLYRPFDRDAFDAQEIERFSRYQVHFRRAMVVRTRLAQADMASMALEQISTAVIVLSRTRKILLANPAAETLLAAAPASLVDRGVLRADRPALTAQLDAALDACAKRAFTKATGSVIRLSGAVGQGLVLRLVPPPARLPVSPQAAAVGFISREGAMAVEPAALMAALYRLTPSETRLVQSLCEGLTPEEHATARGVTMATVKTQLQSVFSKTGVRRQAELVRLAGTLSR